MAAFYAGSVNFLCGRLGIARSAGRVAQYYDRSAFVIFLYLPTGDETGILYMIN